MTVTPRATHIASMKKNFLPWCLLLLEETSLLRVTVSRITQIDNINIFKEDFLKLRLSLKRQKTPLSTMNDPYRVCESLSVFFQWSQRLPLVLFLRHNEEGGGAAWRVVTGDLWCLRLSAPSSSSSSSTLKRGKSRRLLCGAAELLSLFSCT